MASTTRDAKAPAPLTTGAFLAIVLRQPAIMFYIALLAASAVAAAASAESWSAVAVPVALVVAGFPLVEYGLHRFLFHSHLLLRHKATARLWRRLHYDHHARPDDMAVLVSAPATSLPLLILLTLLPGLFAFGVTGAASAFATGLTVLLAYEMVHAAAHLPWATRSPTMRRLRRHHLLHHYFDETGNFGITFDLVDRLAGTRYRSKRGRDPSATARNLGYTGAAVSRFPWVALSIAEDAERAA